MSHSGNDTSNEVDDVSPPWGSPPVEKFLLQRWEPHSSEAADEQRKRLVRGYVKAGSQRASFHITQSVAGTDLGQAPSDGTVSVPPTPAQVASVLRPWRTVEQRNIALDPGNLGSVWLRTCYKEGTDPQHEALVADIDMELAVDREERLLNDAAMYDFGDRWEQVLDYIPELITFRDKDASSRAARLRKAEDVFQKADRVISGSSAPADVEGAPMRLIEGARRRLPAADLKGYVLRFMQLNIHAACVVNYVIVEDEEALQSGDVLLLFLDDCGRVVRRYRLSASEAEQVGGSWFDRSWEDNDFWNESEMGADYQEDGVCGNLLYYRPQA